MALTKFEILKSYSTARRRDSWVALGSQQITDTTRIYVKDMLYQVAVTGSLNTALVLCTENYQSSTAIPWASASINNSLLGYLEFGDAIISPHFRLILTPSEYAAITDLVDSTFIPFNSEYQETGTVQIPDNELELILTEVGIPFITYDELEFSREKILNNMIRPAIEEYFKWFPKTQLEEYNINTTSTFRIQMPSWAYGVVQAGIVQGKPLNGVTNPLLRYFDEIVWVSNSPYMNGRGMRWGNLQGHSQLMLDRAARQGIVNYGTRVHVDIEKDDTDGNKYLTGYTNKTGILVVRFSKYSLNYDDVEFNRRPELRKLCTAKVLRALGMLRSQVKSDLPGTIDFAGFISRAAELEQEVVADWKSLVKASGIMRGGF